MTKSIVDDYDAIGKAMRALAAPAPEPIECLPWPFAIHQSGRAHGRRRPSRMMCEIAHGPAPSALHEAAHNCGKGHDGCVNPKHLRWATHLENMQDGFIHGTNSAGSRHGQAKLTEADVVRMRSMRGTIPQMDIAIMFGVSKSIVSGVLNRRRWKHVP